MAVAPVTGFRKLRDDIVTVRQETPEGILFIVKDPGARRYYKFEENEYAVIECFRGASSLEEVRKRFASVHPGKHLELNSAREFEAALQEMGLLERTLAERNLMVMEKVRDARRKRAGGENGGNLFFITFPAIDPDRIMNRIHPYLKFFWQPWFVVLCLAAMGVMAGIFMAHWGPILRSSIDFYNFRQKTGLDLVQFMGLMFVLVMLHEFAHGMTCKHFGGEVHEIGFVLFYFTPAFYCDVNDAYLFPKKSHKLWVTFAGVYIELLVCSIATFIWLGSRPDSVLHDLSYKAILFTGISSVAFNVNPLVKLDGYYALMDYLEIPNLRERAFGYIGHLLKSRVLRMKTERPITTRRQRRIFVIYGTLALAYTVSMLGIIFGLAWNWIDSFFPGWGLLLALGLVLLMLRKVLLKIAGFLRKLWNENREARMRGRGLVMLSGGTAATLALLLFPRFPVIVRCDVVLEPEHVVFLATRADGIVEKILAGEGDRVRRGEELAVLRNEDLKLHLENAEREKAMADSLARARRSEGRAAEAVEAERRWEELSDRMEDLRRQAESLEVISPVEGVLLTPGVEDRVGMYRNAGEPVLEVGVVGRMRVLIRVSEWDVRWISTGQEVRVHLDAFPFRCFRGRVQSVSPAGFDAPGGVAEKTLEVTTSHRSFEVRAILSNPEGLLLPGMVGKARVYTKSSSVAERILQASLDMARSAVW